MIDINPLTARCAWWWKHQLINYTAIGSLGENLGRSRSPKEIDEESGVWSLKSGVWSLESEVWSMECFSYGYCSPSSSCFLFVFLAFLPMEPWPQGQYAICLLFQLMA